eukprot:TRINITY_DN9835_c0_g2_i1.p1 TRINITY_DN9835_c0_g2~~TRINITY_DN9835_c0_g2_i1.p1  ORF type:complete len:381 (+),score=26.24 TRINITY_DN9835_c0_g2_i1:179-1321(+)
MCIRDRYQRRVHGEEEEYEKLFEKTLSRNDNDLFRELPELKKQAFVRFRGSIENCSAFNKDILSARNGGFYKIHAVWMQGVWNIAMSIYHTIILHETEFQAIRLYRDKILRTEIGNHSDDAYYGLIYKNNGHKEFEKINNILHYIMGSNINYLKFALARFLECLSIFFENAAMAPTSKFLNTLDLNCSQIDYAACINSFKSGVFTCVTRGLSSSVINYAYKKQVEQLRNYYHQPINAFKKRFKELFSFNPDFRFITPQILGDPEIAANALICSRNTDIVAVLSNLRVFKPPEKEYKTYLLLLKYQIEGKQFAGIVDYEGFKLLEKPELSSAGNLKLQKTRAEFLKIYEENWNSSQKLNFNSTQITLSQKSIIHSCSTRQL